MKFGIRYCNTGRYVDPPQAVALLQAAEHAGFGSTWTVEHIRAHRRAARVPVGLPGRIASPDDLASWQDAIRRYAD